VHGPIIRIGNDKFGLRDARRHVVEAIKSWPSRAAAVATAPGDPRSHPRSHRAARGTVHQLTSLALLN
jgi:hypothetical protein